MIVGVNAQGKDMISTKKGDNNLLVSDPEGGNDIYDFVKPCPTACDPGSPLNG